MKDGKINIKKVELPDKKGYFGDFGGSFVPPVLEPILNELTEAFMKYKDDFKFNEELKYYLRDYVGRPSPLYFCKNITNKLGGAKIYLKREDLNHTGAHKINNTLGQILLAKRLGKTRVVAETGAGQHGTATATVCALFGMKCVIYMGEIDTIRQRINVFRMQLLGAEVKTVKSGTRVLKDAVDEALNDYIANKEDTFYLLGSAVGPHPYPAMVKHFQSVVGREAKLQILEKEKRLPDYLIACVGGGSNAIGLFAPFYNYTDVKIIGVEPAGEGLNTDKHAATLTKGKHAVIHGFKSYVLVDENNEPLPVHTIAAGLDYPGVGPEHSFYKDSGRANYVTVTDREAFKAFLELSETEGIIPAFESAHAIAYTLKFAPQLSRDEIIIVNLSGRGDKDVEEAFNMIMNKTYE